MSSLNDLGNAVMREKRRLANMRLLEDLRDEVDAVNEPLPTPPRFPLRCIDQFLRIEVSEKFMWYQMRDYSLNGAFPTTFMGVTVYCSGPEYNLPECGWRVVNPFDKPVGG